jgi:DNA-binding LacI/PurR family transcriptional regulator
MHSIAQASPSTKRPEGELSRRRLEGYLDIVGSNGAKSSVKIWECPRSTEEEGKKAAERLFKERPQTSRDPRSERSLSNGRDCGCA